ncbi:MAG: magnesium transporter [Deltaproteobacteria bacterium]|nr:magnesium transporter [Deltaproteobacteria bacterium]
MTDSKQHITSLISRNFPVLHIQDSVEKVYATFRREGLKHKIIYLYVVDDSMKLLGVVPIHRLLTADPNQLVEDIFIKRCISLPVTTTIKEARKAFSQHKFLAFPVVDEHKHFLGVLNIEAFAGDLGDISAGPRIDDLYDLFGISSDLKKEKSLLRRFALRSPWLLATFTTGAIAAFLTGYFQVTLQESISIFFFLTLVLGLNESIAMQSTTLTVSKLHKQKPNFKNYLASIEQEIPCALLLGIFYGTLTAGASWMWRNNLQLSILLGFTLLITMTLSCFWGVSIPFFFHRIEKDPKVASGPLVLGMCDLVTLLIFFFSVQKFL